MFELVNKINSDCFNKSYNVDFLRAGIIYDKDGYPIDKTIFIQNGTLGIDAISNKTYPLRNNGHSFISSVVPISLVARDILKSETLNYFDVLFLYIFLIDKAFFLNKMLHYFGMEKVTVNGENKIIEKNYRYKMPDSEEKASIYYGLLNIINYKSQNRQVKSNGRTKRK